DTHWQELSGFDATVGAAYSADGSRIAAWDYHGHVAIFDAHNLDVVRRVQANGAIVSGATDRTGSVVAIGSDGGELELVKADGSIVRIPEAHSKSITSVAFSPDNTTLVTSSGDSTARLWEVTGTPRATLVGHIGGLWSAAFSPDGELLATASSDGTARLWTATTGTPRGELVGHTGTVATLAFRPGGAQIVTASWDHRALVWDVARAQQFRALPTASVEPMVAHAKLKYAPDGHTLGLIARDGTLAIWAAGKRVCQVPTGKPLADFAWSPDGTLVAMLHPDGDHVVTVIDARTCGTQAELDQAGEAFAIAFAADGKLAVGGKGVVQWWDVRHAHLDATIPDYPGYVVDLGFAPDGRSIGVTYDDGQPTGVVIHDLAGTRERQVYRAGLVALSSVVLDPLHHDVIATSFDHRAWIWDDRTAKLVDKLEGTGPLLGARLSADHDLLVAVGGNSPVVWAPATGGHLGSLKGHSDLVVAGQFIADHIFITAGLDGVARVWDMATLHPLLSFGGTLAVSVSPNLTEVTLGDRHGTRSWPPRFPEPNFDEIERLQ
ncbi:MAG: hypothetical protein NT062_30650, partial [Proteobacteria bacterium]|nr:hypothetical protein [Pseudomonadota bacterium]